MKFAGEYHRFKLFPLPQSPKYKLPLRKKPFENFLGKGENADN